MIMSKKFTIDLIEARDVAEKKGMKRAFYNILLSVAALYGQSVNEYAELLEANEVEKKDNGGKEIPLKNTKVIKSDCKDCEGVKVASGNIVRLKPEKGIERIKTPLDAKNVDEVVTYFEQFENSRVELDKQYYKITGNKLDGRKGNETGYNELFDYIETVLRD